MTDIQDIINKIQQVVEFRSLGKKYDNVEIIKVDDLGNIHYKFGNHTRIAQLSHMRLLKKYIITLINDKQNRMFFDRGGCYTAINVHLHRDISNTYVDIAEQYAKTTNN